jgi:hypothetical protein
VRRVSRTLETMAASMDSLLGLFAADPEMPGDAVHTPGHVTLGAPGELMQDQPSEKSK